jgi:hypothetical protein
MADCRKEDRARHRIVPGHLPVRDGPREENPISQAKLSRLLLQVSPVIAVSDNHIFQPRVTA